METIDYGDKVNIYFENVGCLFNVTILSMPQATGESWIVKDDLGNISNVGIFARMDKLPIMNPEKKMLILNGMSKEQP